MKMFSLFQSNTKNYTVIQFPVFLTNTNVLYKLKCIELFLSKTNNLYPIICFQVFMPFK